MDRFVDYVIVIIIAVAAALYILRHFRNSIRRTGTASGCPGCGGDCGNTKGKPPCDEQPFPIMENGRNKE